MKKTLRKMTALFLSVCMIMAMGLTAFAEPGDGEGTTPATPAVNNGKVTIKGVEANATINAYQIVKLNPAGYYESVTYTKDGKETPLFTFADPKAPTAAEISAIITNITADQMAELVKTTPVTFLPTDRDTDGNYVKNFDKAGSYLVLVAPGDGMKSIYNPMIVSVNSEDKGLNGGTLDITTVTAKKDIPKVDKKVVGPDTDAGENENGTAEEIGQVINFELDTTIPAYNKSEYKNVTFIVHDNLSEGLDFTSLDDVVVKVNGTDVKDKGATASFDKDNARHLMVSFTSNFILDHPNQAVVVTYNAKLNENAKVNLEANVNTAKVEYTNNPTTGGTEETEEDKTYHYTFGIDASINGNATHTHQINKISHEFIKIDENGNVEEIKKEELGKEDIVEDSLKPLEGAEFVLRKKGSNGTTLMKEVDGKQVRDTEVIAVGTTDKLGKVTLTGMDANVEYELVEIKAPTGYTVNSTPVPVKVEATFNTNGTLASYTINIGGKNTTYTATYKKVGEKTTDVIEDYVMDPDNPYGFKNTTLSKLPSTGGIGTYIFTIVGVVIMVVAGSMFFVSRKKRA